MPRITIAALQAELAAVKAANTALTGRLEAAKVAYREVVRERDALLVAQRPSRAVAAPTAPRVVTLKGVPHQKVAIGFNTWTYVPVNAEDTARAALRQSNTGHAGTVAESVGVSPC